MLTDDNKTGKCHEDGKLPGMFDPSTALILLHLTGCDALWDLHWDVAVHAHLHDNEYSDDIKDGAQHRAGHTMAARGWDGA